MDNKIYAIIEGCYSDWQIIGYVLSEDEAMQICAQHNQDCSFRTEEWYYEEIEKLDSPKKKVGLEYTHIIRFLHSKDGPTMVDDIYNLEYFADGCNPTKEVKIDDSPLRAYITVWVPLKENNREKAEKIAQDALYQLLAEKNGIF